jgi:hypothetical protein
MKKIWLILIPALALSACGDTKGESFKPKTNKDERKDAIGRLTGEEGFTLGGSGDSEKGGGSPLGVNSFLWRASLDTFSFMPLASADPFGGVIITDWYEDPKAPGERVKVNVLILDKTLRADGVKVTLFKQKLEKGSWRDQKVDEKTARALEDTILTRARELRVQQVK